MNSRPLDARPRAHDHTSPADHDVLRVPRLRIALALAVLVYGIVTMACGSSNENTRETQPVERPEFDPYEPGQAQQAPSPDELAAAEAQGQTLGTAEDADPTALPAEAVASADPASAAARPANEVRFAVDEAGLEMGLPMVPHHESTDPAATVPAMTGDWFLENFVYVGGRLDTTDLTEDELTIPESTVVAMRHRQADAEIVVWTEPQSPRDAERYLDVVADDLIGRAVTAPELLDMTVVRLDPNTLASNLQGLALNEATIAGRPALQIDLLRTNPATRIRERTRMLVLRQRTATGEAVLVHVALNARPGDFDAFTAELARTAGRIQLTGQPEPLTLNPDHTMGPVTDAYGLTLAPLEVAPTPVPDAGEASATAGEAAATTSRETIGSAVRRLLGEQRVDAPAADVPAPPARKRPRTGL